MEIVNLAIFNLGLSVLLLSFADRLFSCFYEREVENIVKLFYDFFNFVYVVNFSYILIV